MAKKKLKAAGKRPRGGKMTYQARVEDKDVPCEICSKRPERIKGTGICWICHGEILRLKAIANTPRGRAEINAILEEIDAAGKTE